jgi:hypothetical protein
MCRLRRPSRCATPCSMPVRATLAITANAALTAGHGTFKGGENSDPYVGEPGERHTRGEMKIETVYPANLESKIIDGAGFGASL